jgi:hypothetical protein
MGRAHIFKSSIKIKPRVVVIHLIMTFLLLLLLLSLYSLCLFQASDFSFLLTDPLEVW